MKKTKAKEINKNEKIIEKSDDSEAEYIWENFMYEMYQWLNKFLIIIFN